MAGGGCGTCQPADNPVAVSYTDTSTYTIGDPARKMRGKWSQATFPNVPCPSPQTLWWEYKDSGGTWRQVAPTTNLTAPVRLASGTNGQSANAGTWYTRWVIFQQVGTWQLRTHISCGAAFVSASVSQVVVAAPTARKRVIVFN